MVSILIQIQIRILPTLLPTLRTPLPILLTPPILLTTKLSIYPFPILVYYCDSVLPPAILRRWIVGRQRLRGASLMMPNSLVMILDSERDLHRGLIWSCFSFRTSFVPSNYQL